MNGVNFRFTAFTYEISELGEIPPKLKPPVPIFRNCYRYQVLFEFFIKNNFTELIINL